jgi:DNA-directed RNA polymerase specialized sigma24 family protein
MIAAIEQAGVRDRDEVMEIYTRACEHLAADGCARLKRHDPGKGPLAAWLVAVVRNLVVDWARSRKGRRRLFGVIRSLPETDQRIFELYYWRERRPAEIAEMVVDERGEPIGPAAVFDSLARIEQVLSERHRAELLSMMARRRPPAPLEDEQGQLVVDLPADEASPEALLRIKETAAALAAALGELPPEDALIVSLKYIDGLSDGQVRDALHLDRLPPERVRDIVARLRQRLERRGFSGRTPALVAPIPGGGA